jgi:hypothetical protein
MSATRSSVLWVIGALASAALGANEIRVWYGDPNDPNAYQTNQYDRTVLILAPGTYKIEALDPNEASGLGYINEISIDANCPTGTVNIFIERSTDNDQPGAIDVYWVHLLHASGVTGNLVELRITGDLGSELGTNEASNAGVLALAGGLLSDLWIDNAITGNVIIDTLAADIRAYSMQDLTVTQGSGSFTPSITVAGSTYSATMQVGCALYELYFGGGMSGVVDLSAPLLLLTAWNVGIAGSFTTAAGIDVDEVNIHGPVSGTVSIGGSVTSATVVTDVSGTLSVAGTLKEGLIGDDVSGTITADYIGVVEPFTGLEIEGTVEGSDAAHPALINVTHDVLTFVSAGVIGPYGQIELGGYANQITVGTLEGLVHVGTDLIHTSVSEFAESGVLDVAGDMLSALYTYKTIAGHINLGNDMLGAIIANDFAEGDADLRGAITIGGSMTSNALIFFDGQLHGRGYVGESNDPPLPPDAGSIRINGALDAYFGIEFDGGKLGTQAFITVNYDGYGLETWSGSTPIILGDPDDPNNHYYGNTPAEHLWAVSPCRGDMNNDTYVDMSDVNPFIAALTHPADYALDFPGLVGSRVWKGDANCDGTFDSSDLNPFVALVSNECCDPNCPGCEGGDAPAGGLPDPDDLAADLAANVWPALYDDLLGIILATIDAAPDEETQAYWQAVYAALTQ